MIWTTDLFNELDQLRLGMQPLWQTRIDSGGYAFPQTNAYENREGYTLVLSLPGVAKDKVDIRFANNTVTISGERSELAIAAKREYLRRERDSGSFERVYRFPIKVNADAATAKLENGILLLSVPKAEEAKPKQITIQA